MQVCCLLCVKQSLDFMLFYQRRFITVFWLYSGTFHCMAGVLQFLHCEPAWITPHSGMCFWSRLTFTLVYFRSPCFTDCWNTSSALSIFVYTTKYWCLQMNMNILIKLDSDYKSFEPLYVYPVYLTLGLPHLPGFK